MAYVTVPSRILPGEAEKYHENLQKATVLPLRQHMVTRRGFVELFM